MLPMILRGIVAITTVIGAKKGVDGLVARSQANERESEAECCLADAREQLGTARAKTERRLELLAAARLEAGRAIAEQIIPQLRRISNVQDEGRTYGAQPSTGHCLPNPSMNEVGNSIIAISKGAVIGRMAGAGLSSAAVSLASSFGVASTGTAISGLSGAAATNATLAYLGGGSIASGGAGIAGGMTLLGGVAIGPAVLVAGLRFAGRCEERLVAAERYRADARIAAAQAQEGIVRLDAIGWRADELSEVTIALAGRASTAAAALKVKLDKLGLHASADYTTLPIRARDAVQTLIRLTCELDAVVAIDLYDEIGNLLENSRNTVYSARAACSWRI